MEEWENLKNENKGSGPVEGEMTCGNVELFGEDEETGEQGSI